MPAHHTITVDARRYADADDCLAAAAAAYVAAHPAVAGYDLAPRWGDDDRETIALDVPASAAIGEDPAGRYAACRVEEVEGVDPDDYDQIAIYDAGAEG